VADKIGDLTKFEIMVYHFEVVVGSSKPKKERKKSLVGKRPIAAHRIGGRDNEAGIINI
jgi:hypothetical protein